MKLKLIAFVLLLAGCQNKVTEKKLNWSADSLAPMPRLEEIKGFTFEQKIKLNGHEINFYQQQIGEVKVDTSVVKVLSEKEDKPVLINGNYFEELNVNLNELEKMQKDFPYAFSNFIKARSDLKKMKLLKKEIILGKSGRQIGAMNSFIVEDPSGRVWEIRVKNRNRFVSLKKMGSNFENNGNNLEAQLFPRGPKQSQISRVQLFDLNLGKTLVGTGLKVSSVKDLAPVSSDELLSLTPSNEKFDQVQVFYFSQQALRWTEEKLKIKLNSDIDIQVHTGAPEKTNIAFYYDQRIRLGSGDDELYAKIPQDPSIVEHETFHAVIDQMCRLPFEGEGGSLNEGLADILTAFHLDQPNLGEVAFLKGEYKRTVENKSKYTDRNGSLYHDSLIFSGLMWELRNKIGEVKTLNLTYNLLLKLGPNSNFSELRKIIQTEIKNVYSAKEYEVASQILRERAWWSD